MNKVLELKNKRNQKNIYIIFEDFFHSNNTRLLIKFKNDNIFTKHFKKIF